MWIKWSDREPEAGKQILVSGFNYNCPSDGRWLEAVWFDGSAFYDEQENMEDRVYAVDLYPPTHWAPVPEPPTE